MLQQVVGELGPGAADFIRERFAQVFPEDEHHRAAEPIEVVLAQLVEQDVPPAEVDEHRGDDSGQLVDVLDAGAQRLHEARRVQLQHLPVAGAASAEHVADGRAHAEDFQEDARAAVVEVLTDVAPSVEQDLLVGLRDLRRVHRVRPPRVAARPQPLCAEPKPFDNEPSHSMCCHLVIGAGTKILPIQ